MRTIAALEVAHIRVLLDLLRLQERQLELEKQKLYGSHEKTLLELAEAETKEIPSWDTRYRLKELLKDRLKTLEEQLQNPKLKSVRFESVEVGLQWSGGALRPLLAELSQRDLITGWSSESGQVLSIGVSPFGMSLLEYLRTDEQLD
jgi:hypothetical protein